MKNIFEKSTVSDIIVEKTREKTGNYGKGEKMIIKNKEEFEKIVKKFEFRFAKTYANFAPHEYIVSNEEGEMLETIQALNRFIQENYDETEMFFGKEYQVLFVGKHKYWSMDEWDKTNILNRNWDYKNEDGTTNVNVTQSYLTKDN